ncbi:MAG: 30S ribosome-binding factor RbfA [Pseudomonadota bacterium]|nr:30S ribosome-binding factor RbfA [Pseudomonadota bacterium]
MPRDFPRSRRVEDQIQRVLSDVLRIHVRDPRLSSIIISSVKVSKDLGVARVYYSVLNQDSKDIDFNEVIASAINFLRRKLAEELTVRRVPELRFLLDETFTHAKKMDQLISIANADNRDSIIKEKNESKKYS